MVSTSNMGEAAARSGTRLRMNKFFMAQKNNLGFDVTEYKNENDNMKKRSNEGVCGE